jgi:hypothetical protein
LTRLSLNMRKFLQKEGVVDLKEEVEEVEYL